MQLCEQALKAVGHRRCAGYPKPPENLVEAVRRFGARWILPTGERG
jgi:hypothetical protein